MRSQFLGSSHSPSMRVRHRVARHVLLPSRVAILMGKMIIKRFMPRRSYSGGYYDDEGNWKRMKFCFMYCGKDRCDCGPPGGRYHDSGQIKSKNKAGE